MSGYQWLGLVVLVGWVSGLLTYAFKSNASLAKTMLLGFLVGGVMAVPVLLGIALLAGELP